MDTTSLNLEDDAALASWDRPRSTEELLDFIARRHASLVTESEGE